MAAQSVASGVSDMSALTKALKERDDAVAAKKAADLKTKNQASELKALHEKARKAKSGSESWPDDDSWSTSNSTSEWQPRRVPFDRDGNPIPGSLSHVVDTSKPDHLRFGNSPQFIPISEVVKLLMEEYGFTEENAKHACPETVCNKMPDTGSALCSDPTRPGHSTWDDTAHAGLPTDAFERLLRRGVVKEEPRPAKSKGKGKGKGKGKKGGKGKARGGRKRSGSAWTG